MPTLFRTYQVNAKPAPFVLNQKRSWVPYTSFSESAARAEKFATDPTAEYYTLQAKTTANDAFVAPVWMLSAFPDEREWLFAPNTTYTCQKLPKKYRERPSIYDVFIDVHSFDRMQDLTPGELALKEQGSAPTLTKEMCTAITITDPAYRKERSVVPAVTALAAKDTGPVLASGGAELVVGGMIGIVVLGVIGALILRNGSGGDSTLEDAKEIAKARLKRASGGNP